jgi:chitin synthase
LQSKKHVIETVEKEEQDLMEDFRKTAIRALAPFKAPPDNHTPSEDDSNRTFRTRLIVFWMLSNASMVFAIQNIAGLNPNDDLFHHRQSMYFNAVLIGVFFVTLVKFLGCCWFWLFHEVLVRLN